MKSAWEEVEKMIIEMNTTILSISQRGKDLEIENERLKRLVETYKAKSELIIELTDPLVPERKFELVK
jgi:hypothetical protein